MLFAVEDAILELPAQHMIWLYIDGIHAKIPKSQPSKYKVKGEMMKLEIKSGKEVDPFEDGKFPLCYVGNDMDDGLDYWIVGYTEKMSVREQANYIIGMQTEIESLKKQLAEEKARTNMLNFGQVGK